MNNGYSKNNKLCKAADLPVMVQELIEYVPSGPKNQIDIVGFRDNTVKIKQRSEVITEEQKEYLGTYSID